jgi:hypothetical protein
MWTLDGAMAIAAERAGDTAVDVGAAYELAYKEATRAIESQMRSLESVRTRAGLLLSTAALVAGFLGPAAAETVGVPYLIAGLGDLAFLIATGLLVASLLPPSNWRAAVSPKKLLADYIEASSPATMAEIHRSIAWHMEDDWDGNERSLWRRNILVAVAGISLVVETACWLVAIAYG